MIKEAVYSDSDICWHLLCSIISKYHLIYISLTQSFHLLSCKRKTMAKHTTALSHKTVQISIVFSKAQFCEPNSLKNDSLDWMTLVCQLVIPKTHVKCTLTLGGLGYVVWFKARMMSINYKTHTYPAPVDGAASHRLLQWNWVFFWSRGRLFSR